MPFSYCALRTEYRVIEQADSSIKEKTRYLHKDHLGSTDLITDENGDEVQRLSFDPFGSRRAAPEWSNPVLVLQELETKQGFTGHEHLDELGLIHMNGRLYDAALGRFVSADPFVQSAGNSQSYNRYSYVFNNPLAYNDPSGYLGSAMGREKAARLVISRLLKLSRMIADLRKLPISILFRIPNQCAV